MRTPLLLLAALLAGLPLPGQANECPGEPVFETADRCRATYIDVLTGNRQWLSIEEGELACFEPGEALWEWKCRGYTEATRCRRVSPRDNPRVEVFLLDGEVTWTCFVD